MTRPPRTDADRRTVLKLAPLALAGGLDLFAGRVAADDPLREVVESGRSPADLWPTAGSVADVLAVCEYAA